MTKPMLFGAALLMALGGVAQAVPILLQNASVTYDQGAPYTIESAIDGVLTGSNGWGVYNGQGNPQAAVFQTTAPIYANALGFQLIHGSPHGNHTVNEFQISVTSDPNPTITSGATWTPLVPALVSSTGASRLDNVAGIHTRRSNPVTTDTYNVLADNPVHGVTGIRLDVFKVGSYVGGGGNGNFVLSEFVAGTSEVVPVALQEGTAVRSQTNLSVDYAIDNLHGSSWYTGWGNDVGGANTAAFETVEDAGYGGGSVLTFTLDARSFGDHNIGRFRVSATTDERDTFANGLDNGGDVTANWTELVPISALSRNGDTLSILPDNSVLLDESTSKDQNDIYTITAQTSMTGITGFRLEALQDSTLPHSGPGTADVNGNFVLTEFTVTVATIPEPSTLLIWSLLAGLGIGVGWRRRR